MNNPLLRHILIVLTVILILPLIYSCQKSNVLPVDTMVNILFDIYRFDAVAQNVDYSMDNNTKARYYNGIFQKYGTDKSNFDQSLKWYANHPDKWRLVYEKLSEKSEKYMELVQNGQLPELKERGIAQQTMDTLNYWISRNNMYWYSDEDIPIDFSRLRQTLNGRKYFIGASRVELTFLMRCKAETQVSTEASMIIQYVRGTKKDTLRVSAQADNKWHRYHIYSSTPDKSISAITIFLADSISASKLTLLEYEDVHFSYIYSKKGEHIDAADKRQFTSDRMYNMNRQTRFNVKRDENGGKDSSEQDNSIEFSVSRRGE